MQPVWKQLQERLKRAPNNDAWRQRLQQQQQQTQVVQQQADRLQQHVDDLDSYMKLALEVMTHCSNSSSMVQVVSAMCGITRSALAGSPAAAGGPTAPDPVSDGGQPSDDAGNDDHEEGEASRRQSPEQRQAKLRYMKLQQQVMAFCQSSPAMLEALNSMEGIALRAIRPCHEQG